MQRLYNCEDGRGMKHTEYIIPIGEDAQDYDEMFIGVIRRQPELVRCKDCRYYGKRMENGFWSCGRQQGCVMTFSEGFCGWAVRRKENG